MSCKESDTGAEACVNEEEEVKGECWGIEDAEDDDDEGAAANTWEDTEGEEEKADAVARPNVSDSSACIYRAIVLSELIAIGKYYNHISQSGGMRVSIRVFICVCVCVCACWKRATKSAFSAKPTYLSKVRKIEH